MNVIFSVSSQLISVSSSEGDVLSLHLLQLAFGDRKCLASGQILYEVNGTGDTGSLLPLCHRFAFFSLCLKILTYRKVILLFK